MSVRHPEGIRTPDPSRLSHHSFNNGSALPLSYRYTRWLGALASRTFHTTLLALALAGCQTIKPLPPTGRVIPCSTVAPVNPNVEAVDHMTDRVARQSLGNDLVIEKLCARKK